MIKTIPIAMYILCIIIKSIKIINKANKEAIKYAAGKKMKKKKKKREKRTENWNRIKKKTMEEKLEDLHVVTETEIKFNFKDLEIEINNNVGYAINYWLIKVDGLLLLFFRVSCIYY